MQMADYDYNKYNSWSSLYDTLMLAGYYDYDSFVENLVSCIKTYSLKSCLEIGVGTGLVASKLTKRVDVDFLGVDFSEDMIAECQTNFPDIKTAIGDIASYDFAQTYDLIFSVGGPWYFMEDDDGLMFCSHLPEIELQNRSIKNICQAMHKGSVLALAVQGPHIDKSINISDSLTFTQVIRKKTTDGSIFEKDYIFIESGAEISRQTCLFRLTKKAEIETYFSDCGLELLSFGDTEKFIFYRKS